MLDMDYLYLMFLFYSRLFHSQLVLRIYYLKTEFNRRYDGLDILYL